jgi:hypothetical protein
MIWRFWLIDYILVVHLTKLFPNRYNFIRGNRSVVRLSFVPLIWMNGQQDNIEINFIVLLGYA